jgi:hypothetical protein
MPLLTQIGQNIEKYASFKPCGKHIRIQKQEETEKFIPSLTMKNQLRKITVASFFQFLIMTAVLVTWKLSLTGTGHLSSH